MAATLVTGEKITAFATAAWAVLAEAEAALAVTLAASAVVTA